MDNAAYLCLQKNKIPSILTLKVEMQKWLRKKGIHFSPKMTKVQIMKIIRTVSPTKKYNLDENWKSIGMLPYKFLHTTQI